MIAVSMKFDELFLVQYVYMYIKDPLIWFLKEKYVWCECEICIRKVRKERNMIEREMHGLIKKKLKSSINNINKHCLIACWYVIYINLS